MAIESTYINYVNSVMSEINDITTELYEALADNDTLEARAILDRLEESVIEVKESLTDET